MKCQKCDYISFDYNLVCPNCSASLSGERDKLRITELKPIDSFDELFGQFSTTSSIVVAENSDEVEFDLDDENDQEDPLKSFVLD